jgi:hypothetical protein
MSSRSLDAVQLQHARDFVASIGGREYDLLASLMADGFTHRFFPVSLNGMGMPVRNAQEFVDHVREVSVAIAEFNVSYLYAFSSRLEVNRCRRYQLQEKDVIQGKDVVVLHVGQFYTPFFSLVQQLTGISASSRRQDCIRQAL